MLPRTGGFEGMLSKSHVNVRPTVGVCRSIGVAYLKAIRQEIKAVSYTHLTLPTKA